MSPSLRKAIAAAIGGGAVAIASVLITGPSGDDGLEGVSYIPYKDIVGVWTVCHGHTGKDIMLGKTYKGSSKGHTPREAKDNLKSTQLLSVIDAISEGPIEGPVDGLKSVLLNSTPVLDTEGNTNISGVTVVFRAGEQEQTPPEGFESSGSETVLGTEVKYDTPITRTITSANIDRLRFTFGVQALVETTSKGDRNPSEVRLLVQIQRNGGWVTEKDITIKGKTTSQYLASVVVDNLPSRPFNIRMRRMTPDSTTDQLQNKTLWSSYTEIIDMKQCYPNTALVGVQVDSEQFGSQQVSRNYHLRGRILQVP